MSRLNPRRVQSMISQLNREVLPLISGCRMFERARIELAGFNRVDRSVDTAQKPLRIGCEVKKGFDDSEIRAEFSELSLGIFSSTRNFSHWIFKTFLPFFLFSSLLSFFFSLFLPLPFDSRSIGLSNR